MSENIKITKEKKHVNKTYDEYVVNERWKRYKHPQYLEYRKKWHEHPEKMIVGDFPIHLDIEITNYCNLHCPMCSRTIQIKDKSFEPLKHIEFDVFKRIIDEGIENGLCSVKFNYLGEPLMHPDVVEMVKYCKEKGIIDVMFNTNGVMLTEEISRGLLEAKLDGIFVSFDTNDKQKFEDIRVGAKFDKVVENVKRFYEIRNSEEKYWGTQIRISKILFPEEEDKDIVEFINYWKNYVDSVGFGSLVEYDDVNDMEYNPNYRCDQPWQRIFISANGVMFTCCLDSKKEYVLGNIYKNTVKEVWNGEKLNKLRNAHKCGKYNEIDVCKNCRYLSDISIKFEKEEK